MKKFFARGANIQEEILAKQSTLMGSVTGANLPFLLTAGPNSKVSHFGMGLDTIAWYVKAVADKTIMRVLPEKGADEFQFRMQIMLESPLYKWVIQLHDVQFLLDFQEVFSQVIHRYLPQKGSRVVTLKNGKTKEIAFNKNLILGKLSTKFEPAGKIRLFAIVDYWTQRAMKPLHSWVFDKLKDLEMDGTFDQEGAVEYLKQFTSEETHSFDLKSATDLIPIELYQELLSYMLGKDAAQAWVNVMQSRDFVTPPGSDVEQVRYTRGQPMGALSSWAMLAMAHHLVVQYAHYMANLYWPTIHSFHQICGGWR